jgi:predicted DNA-binding transcriptional regulator AlpA
MTIDDDDHTQDRIVRESGRWEMIRIPASVWQELQERGLAPKPLRLSGRSVGWSFHALGQWLRARLNAKLIDSVIDGDAWQSLGEAVARAVSDAARKGRPS